MVEFPQTTLKKCRKNSIGIFGLISRKNKNSCTIPPTFRNRARHILIKVWIDNEILIILRSRTKTEFHRLEMLQECFALSLQKFLSELLLKHNRKYSKESTEYYYFFSEISENKNKKSQCSQFNFFFDILGVDLIQRTYYLFKSNPRIVKAFYKEILAICFTKKIRCKLIKEKYE